MSDTVVLSSSPVMGQLPGDVIAGKYRLERELGKGAMGTVWSAMHVTLGQRVAIKLIAGDQSRSPEARQRFSTEAKAAARLRSRHAVQVYDDGEMPDGTPYIVMEYLEGETLEERLDSERDLSLAEAVRITTHVGRALARAHAQGVVHRDLKSGNIFIATSDDDEHGWVAKVLDFGVAKVLNEVNGPSATKTGTIVGTPLFMSPEQIRGASQVDHRADLYSLGIVFYNMVTGAHAFDGPSYSDVLVAICTETLPDIRTAAPWLPTGMKSWFDKACARERDDRFQSADEMIEALQDAAGPAARLSRPSTPEEMSGPSGTLVGHVPPHAAATILAGDFGDLPAAPKSAAGGGRRPSSTLKSAPPDPLSATLAEPVRRPRRDNLFLWASAGVGLAALTTVLVLAASRAGSPTADSGSRAGAVTAPPAALSPVVATPAPTTPTSPPQQQAPALASVPVKASQPADPPTPARVVPAARAAAPRRTLTTARRAVPTTPGAPTSNPAVAARAADPPRSTVVSNATPDMGF